MKRKSVISLILRVGAKPLENGFIPPLDGSDGDVGVRVPEFYICVKDTGTKYQLWISDFNIDGTFTRDVAIINRNANYNSVYLLKKGVNHSDVTKDNVNEKCYFIGNQANSNNLITEFDFRFGPYFIPNKVGTNKKADYNWIRGNNGQDTDKAVRVLLLGGNANAGSKAGSGYFDSSWVRSDSSAYVGFFTTVKLD